MLGAGDGIAILGVCAMLITGWWAHMKNKTLANGGSLMTKELCLERRAHTDGELEKMNRRLDRIEDILMKLLIHAGIEPEGIRSD